MKFPRKKVVPFGLIMSALVTVNAQAVTEEAETRLTEEYSDLSAVNSLDASVAEMDAAIVEFERVLAAGPSQASAGLPPLLYLNSDAETSDTLTRWASQYDYVVQWNTDKTVQFANGMTYSGDFRSILTSLADDIASMGIDLNFKVFEKNKVIVVYSVR